jgi:hypothetical protein
VEVGSELAALGRVQRGRHHAHVDRLGGAGAHRHDLRQLQRAQQLGLHGRAQLRHLVQEQRAAVGGGERAHPIGERAGERALLVAEQLGLRHLGGDRGAVERHPRSRAPAALVQRPRGDLLSRPRLPEEQHRAAAGGHGQEAPAQALGHVRGTEQALQLGRRARGALVGHRQAVVVGLLIHHQQRLADGHHIVGAQGGAGHRGAVHPGAVVALQVLQLGRGQAAAR